MCQQRQRTPLPKTMNRRKTSRTQGSAHRLLRSYSLGLLRSLSLTENPAKIGQKSVYFHECEFFSPLAPTTYKSDPSKQTDFLAANPWKLSPFASLPLCVSALEIHRKPTKTDCFRPSAPVRVTGQNETFGIET